METERHKLRRFRVGAVVEEQAPSVGASHPFPRHPPGCYHDL
jgi:hypothetical protein